MAKHFDPTIFDHPALFNTEALDALLAPDTLESIAEQLNQDENTISFEDAQRLGIIGDPS